MLSISASVRRWNAIAPITEGMVVAELQFAAQFYGSQMR
jgi:hypothetical protein